MIDLLYAPLIPIADDVGVEDPIRRASQGRDIAISHWNSTARHSQAFKAARNIP